MKPIFVVGEQQGISTEIRRHSGSKV